MGEACGWSARRRHGPLAPSSLSPPWPPPHQQAGMFAQTRARARMRTRRARMLWFARRARCTRGARRARARAHEAPPATKQRAHDARRECRKLVHSVVGLTPARDSDLSLTPPPDGGRRCGSEHGNGGGAPVPPGAQSPRLSLVVHVLVEASSLPVSARSPRRPSPRPLVGPKQHRAWQGATLAHSAKVFSSFKAA